MKKFLLLSVASAAIFGFSAVAKAGEHIKHSPYIGLAAGWITSHHDVNLTRQITALKDDFSVQEQSLAGEIVLGWGIRWKDVHMSAELMYLHSANNDATAKLAAVGGGRADVRVKTNYAFSGALRLGYFLLKDAMVYVRAGFEHRDFDVRAVLNTTGVTANNITDSFHDIGFTPGIGFEYDVTDNFSLGGEFRTTFFQSCERKRGETSIKIEPRVDTYLVRVSYKLWDLFN